MRAFAQWSHLRLLDLGAGLSLALLLLFYLGGLIYRVYWYTNLRKGRLRTVLLVPVVIVGIAFVLAIVIFMLYVIIITVL
jgi:hypothetical protein